MASIRLLRSSRMGPGLSHRLLTVFTRERITRLAGKWLAALVWEKRMALAAEVARIIYGDKPHDGTDAGMLRAVADMLDRCDDVVDAALARKGGRDMQNDLRRIADRIADPAVLVDFVEYLKREESIQGTLDDRELMLEYADEFLTRRTHERSGDPVLDASVDAGPAEG